MYKFHHDQLPPVLENMFLRNNNSHNYNTRGGNLFKTPSAQLKCLSQTVKNKGVFWWNKLVKQIDINCSLSVLKKKS